MKTYTFFIPGNTPSLKNSKIKTKHGIFPSKSVTKYLQFLGIRYYSVKNKIVTDYKTKPNLFKESLKNFPELNEKDYPIKIKFHFIRKTSTDFDFNNATQIIQDLLVAHNYIIDDNMRYLIPSVLMIKKKYYTINKNNPGVIIKINL